MERLTDKVIAKYGGIMENIEEIALTIGASAGILTILIPVIMYFILLYWWKPKGKLTYSLRFFFWPFVFFSSQLAGPFTRFVAGIHSEKLMNIDGVLAGATLLAVVVGVIGFLIGFFIYDKETGKGKPLILVLILMSFVGSISGISLGQYLFNLDFASSILIGIVCFVVVGYLTEFIFNTLGIDKIKYSL